MNAQPPCPESSESASPPFHLLRRLPYFIETESPCLAMLARQAVRQTLETGEIVFLEGEPSAGLWIIESGHVKVYKLSPNGAEHIIHLLGPGRSFNDIAALDGGPNPASAAALDRAVVWMLSPAALADALRADPALATGAIRFLTARVRTLVGQIEDLALHPVATRLARFLLAQAQDPALSGPGVTRVAIAAHLATTPESISRALRALEEAGAIRFDRHHIVIAREDLLRAIALL